LTESLTRDEGKGLIKASDTGALCPSESKQEQLFDRQEERLELDSSGDISGYARARYRANEVVAVEKERTPVNPVALQPRWLTEVLAMK
jgi:hypothetical protein